MYISKWVQALLSQNKNNVSKKMRKEKIQKVLTTSLKKKKTLPLTKKSPILILPLRTWLLSYLKLLHFFVMRASNSSSHFVVTGRASILILITIVGVTSLSSDASGEGERDSTKPPRWACHHTIRPIRVFTWHNTSLSVSRQASMCWSCVMIALKVTPPVEEEGVDVDGVEELPSRSMAASIKAGPRSI